MRKDQESLHVKCEDFKLPNGRLIGQDFRVEYGNCGHKTGRDDSPKGIKTLGYRIHNQPLALQLSIQPINSKGKPSLSHSLNVPERFWIGTALNILLDKLDSENHLPCYLGLDPLLDELIRLRLEKDGKD